MRRMRLVQVLTPVLAFAGAGVAHSGEAIVTNQPADSVSIVDLDTMKSVAEIKIGGKPAGIALSPDKATAYVTAQTARRWSRLMQPRALLNGGWR